MKRVLQNIFRPTNHFICQMYEMFLVNTRRQKHWSIVLYLCDVKIANCGQFEALQFRYCDHCLYFDFRCCIILGTDLCGEVEEKPVNYNCWSTPQNCTACQLHEQNMKPYVMHAVFKFAKVEYENPRSCCAKC